MDTHGGKIPMALNSISTNHFAAGISPYTIAMGRCLGKLNGQPESSLDLSVVHTLINLVQGRMLEYLADRICREYEVGDPHAKQRIVTVLLRIFSDEFFALFRSKVEYKPNLVIKIARRISRKELPAESHPASLLRLPSDRLFPAIFRKYFEYKNLGILLRMVESDTEIQKILLLGLLRKWLPNGKMADVVEAIMESDPEGVAPNLFMGYLRDGHPQTLVEKVESGEWKPELKAMKKRMAVLRGE